MTHTTHARLAGIVASGGLLVAAIAAPSVALATRPSDHTVTICHATNSDDNPYVEETVDISSSGHLRGGHDTQHDGPIWRPGLKAAHVAWGDIIPAYVAGDFSYPGQNLDPGEAVLDAGCVVDTAGAPVVGQPADELPSDGNATDTPPTDETPTDTTGEQPTDAAPTDATPTDEGEVVYDPIFLTPTPESTPVGEVLAATGRPEVTPPATDSLGAARATASGTGIQALLLVLAGLSTSVLLLGRVPAARRR